MKRKLVILITLPIFMLLGGCENVSLPSDINDTHITDVALRHMEEKYGERFEFYSLWGVSPSLDHEMIVKNENHPSQMIYVKVENFREDDRVFLDNFIAVKHRDDTIAFLNDIANSIFSESIIHYEVVVNALSPDLPPNATLEQFFADTSVPLAITVEVSVRNFDNKEQATRFAEIVANSVHSFYLTIIVVDDSDYGTFDLETLSRNSVLGQFVYCAKIARLDNEFVRFEWLEREE